MNQRTVVARALSEVLKIVGALGIVNLFTLSMMNRSLIKHRPDMHDSVSVHPLDHFQVIPDVRGLWDPDPWALFAGGALILMFVRFVYGSIILLDGEYVSRESQMPSIHPSDWLTILVLLAAFPLLSFYGGMGRIAPFAAVLGIALFVDAVGMWIVAKEDTNSSFETFRNSWKWINSITVGAFIVGLALLPLLEIFDVHVDPKLISVVLVAIYFFGSVVDIRRNRAFYLGNVAIPPPGGGSPVSGTGA